MSTYNLHQPHYGFDFVASAVEGAGDLIHSTMKRVRKNFKERQAIRDLQAMNDLELSDLGIHRGEIEKVVRGR